MPKRPGVDDRFKKIMSTRHVFMYSDSCKCSGCPQRLSGDQPGYFRSADVEDMLRLAYTTGVLDGFEAAEDLQDKAEKVLTGKAAKAKESNDG